jgi:hypothetical protein
MNNNKGSTLAIALSMVFLFAAMGVGTINYGGGQRAFWNSRASSAQAFWVADGAMQQALNYIKTNSPTTAHSSGTVTLSNTSNYNYSSTASNPYTVIATGNVLSSTNSNVVSTRTIQATIENYNGITHDTAATYSGTIDHSGAVSKGSGGTALANGAILDANLTADKVFGTSLANVEALATKTYANGATIPNPLVVTGLTVIKTTSALDLLNLSSSSPVVLIVDTTGAATPEASDFITLGATSSAFNGVIFVLGNLYLDKNSNVDGAVYVQGDLSFHDSGGGNGGIIFGNSTDVSGVGSYFTGQYFVNSWSECKNTTCT